MNLKDYDLFNLFNNIPVNINKKDYNLILNKLKNDIDNNIITSNNINNKYHFLKSKIIERIFIYLNKNFNDNTLKNVFDIDIINKDLHILIEIKYNSIKYGLNGTDYNGLLNNSHEYLAFNEKKIKEYFNKINENKSYELYICIYSEPNNQFYYINFYKLLQLYNEKKYEQFNINKNFNNGKSSLFININEFIGQDDFNKIINKKRKTKELINKYKNNDKIEYFIKYYLLKFKFYGLNFKKLNNISNWEINFYDIKERILFSNNFHYYDNILIVKNTNKIYYHNNEVQIKDIIDKLKKGKIIK